MESNNIISKIPLETFLKYHNVLSVAKNKKYCTAETSVVLERLSLSPFGSEQWILSYEFAIKLNKAVETFNMFFQIIRVLNLLIDVTPQIKKYKFLLDGIISNWDAHICTPNSIQNYMEYYKEKKVKATHPVIYLIKTFGIFYLNQHNINEKHLVESLEKFLIQYNVSDKSKNISNLFAMPQQTETKMLNFPIKRSASCSSLPENLNKKTKTDEIIIIEDEDNKILEQTPPGEIEMDVEHKSENMDINDNEIYSSPKSSPSEYLLNLPIIVEDNSKKNEEKTLSIISKDLELKPPAQKMEVSESEEESSDEEEDEEYDKKLEEFFKQKKNMNFYDLPDISQENMLK